MIIYWCLCRWNCACYILKNVLLFHINYFNNKWFQLRMCVHMCSLVCLTFWRDGGQKGSQLSQASNDQCTFTVSYRMSAKLYLVHYSLAYFQLTLFFSAWAKILTLTKSLSIPADQYCQCCDSGLSCALCIHPPVGSWLCWVISKQGCSWVKLSVLREMNEKYTFIHFIYSVMGMHRQ
jgi:hypothetical protein